MKMIRTSRIVLVVALALATFTSLAQAARVAGTGVITYVTDGDTFKLKPNDPGAWAELYRMAARKQQDTGRDMNLVNNYQRPKGVVTVRVGNINTPESVHRDQSRNSPHGFRASSYAQELLHNQAVSFACWDIGNYGRAICSVWTKDWEFGTRMIRAGFSDYSTRFGEHPFLHQQYQEAQQAGGLKH